MNALFPVWFRFVSITDSIAEIYIFVRMNGDTTAAEVEKIIQPFFAAQFCEKHFQLTRK